ncbi:MAG: VWA domain-containing protein [Lachnospiraceae bacterium]|nr:VWA domain-containing protein [Lachnospiraceae bacterium]
MVITAASASLFACGKKTDAEDVPAYNQSNYVYSSSASACCASSSGSSMYACASSPVSYSNPSYPVYYLGEEEYNTEEYDSIKENVFKDVTTSPLSTFSADVDTASYSNVRRMINVGCDPNQIPEGSIRAEEMINYFSYEYAGPQGDEPFGVNAEISTCPWNEENKLVRLGIQTEEISFKDSPDANIVLLIDVSGSMDASNKLPLVKESFKLMLDNLGKKDRVSIVTYASGTDIVLEGEKGSNKRDIEKALDSLVPGGSTHGEGGIEEAYKIAEENFIKDGNNRIILASDGDFNVGRTSQSELEELISKKREKGIYLTILGYGMGNYSDVRMETLADAGNGNYAYIDSLMEAKKVLVDEFGANMITVAKDVKFQIEFNPAYVSEYRLIGYENRALNNEDFEDDKKDAGEIGAGHNVTVLYEIVPAKDESYNGDNLKYQTSSLTKEALESDEWLTLSVRYKEPKGITSKLLNYNIGSNCYTDKPSNDFLFAASVAEFAMILRHSDYVADGSFEHVSETLGKIRLNDEYKKEFADIVAKASDY